MKIVPVIFLFFLIANSIPHSYANVPDLKPSQNQDGWMQNGKPVPDTDNMKSKNGFGAALWLISDPSIFDKWDKEEAPNFNITKTAIRNKPIFLIFLIINPEVDSSTMANVTADVTITSPDGGIYGNFKGMEIWQRNYPFPNNTFQLGIGHLGINIEDDEQLGVYKINAIVKDNNKNVILNLKTDFVAEEK